MGVSDVLDRVSAGHEIHEEGTTEPWIAELLCSLLRAHGGTTVLETGAYLGWTSRQLALALGCMGGGRLYVAEIDPQRADTVKQRLDDLDLPSMGIRHAVLVGDVLRWVHDLPPASLDFVFVDDDHHSVHVEQEILALWKKVRPGGIIAFHDVVGSTAEIGRLVKKYGGVVLDLPRLGPGGGLGVLQIPK